MISKVCQKCGKGTMKGHQVSHAKQRTIRFSKPNLQKAKVVVKGVKTKMVLCTKCLKKIKKQTLEQFNKQKAAAEEKKEPVKKPVKKLLKKTVKAEKKATKKAKA
ncbi:50S ribosomal protein L28 [Patescibacteria group bacterium]